MKNILSFISLAILFATCCRSAEAQSFSISTSVTPLAGVSSQYDFVLRYDEAGQNLQLTDNIWSWGFYLEAETPTPDVVLAPTNWNWDYDSSTGSFTYFTEGPDGWYTGDFGSSTLAAGGDLAGFSIQGPYLPTIGVASALDVQFNSDQNSAVLPGEVANAVPEPSSVAVLGVGLVLAMRRKRHPIQRRSE